MMPARIQGWESRLAATLEAARRTPYELGTNDCLRLACACVEALTGIDHWPRFAGYHSKRQALVTIARIAPSLGEAVTATLGVPPSRVFAAWRGDLVLYRDPGGEDHLAVADGPQVAVYTDAGLGFLPLADPGLLCSWRIG